MKGNRVPIPSLFFHGPFRGAPGMIAAGAALDLVLDY